MHFILKLQKSLYPAFKRSLLRGSRPKSATPSPQQCTQCSRFHPHRFTFGGVIAESVKTAKSPGKVNPIFARSIASSRITRKPLVEVVPATLAERTRQITENRSCWICISVGNTIWTCQNGKQREDAKISNVHRC